MKVIDVFGGGQALLDRIDVSIDDRSHPLHDLLVTHGLDLGVDAQGLGVFHRPDEFGRVHHDLGRDAPSRETDPSRLVLVDDRDPNLGILLNQRIDEVHPGTGAEDDEIVFLHGNPLPASTFQEKHCATRCSTAARSGHHADGCESLGRRVAKTLNRPRTHLSTWRNSTERSFANSSRRCSTRCASTRGPNVPIRENTGTTTSPVCTCASSAGESSLPRRPNSTPGRAGRASGRRLRKGAWGTKKIAACSCGGPRSSARTAVRTWDTCSTTAPSRPGSGIASTPPPSNSGQVRPSPVEDRSTDDRGISVHSASSPRYDYIGLPVCSRLLRNHHGRTPETRKHRACRVPREGTEEGREVLCESLRMEIPRGARHELLVVPGRERSRWRHRWLATRKLDVGRHQLHLRELRRGVPGEDQEGRRKDHRTEE